MFSLFFSVKGSSHYRLSHDVVFLFIDCDASTHFTYFCCFSHLFYITSEHSPLIPLPQYPPPPPPRSLHIMSPSHQPVGRFKQARKELWIRYKSAEEKMADAWRTALCMQVWNFCPLSLTVGALDAF